MAACARQCNDDEPVVMHIAAEVKRLIDHVMADHADDDIAGTGIDQHARYPREQRTENSKNDEHAPRKKTIRNSLIVSCAQDLRCRSVIIKNLVAAAIVAPADHRKEHKFFIVIRKSKATTIQ